MDLVYLLVGVAVLCGLAGVWAYTKQPKPNIAKKDNGVSNLSPKQPKSYRHIVIAIIFFLLAGGCLYLYYWYQQ
jgi:hypothetical protein